MGGWLKPTLQPQKENMYSRIFIVVFGALIFSGSALAQLREIQVNPAISHAPLPEGSGMDKSCGFDEVVVKSLIENSKRSFKIHDKEMPDFQGRRLTLFLNSTAETGPATSKNPKWVLLTGELREKDQLVGNFEFRQELNWASFQDCKAVKYMADYFGSSVASWLDSPRILTRVHPVMEVKKDSLDEEVRKTCSADTALPKYLSDSNEGLVVTNQVPSTMKHYELLLTIEGSYIAGGSYFSGGKWLAISGKLMDGDKQIGSFEGSRWTLGGYRLCSTLEYLTSYIGSDILHWLRAPAMNSTLGGK
jgi:hypothetical protein